MESVLRKGNPKNPHRFRDRLKEGKVARSAAYSVKQTYTRAYFNAAVARLRTFLSNQDVKLSLRMEI